MTLEGKSAMKEGWLMVFKSQRPKFFSSKPVPDKQLDRAWAVLHQFSSKGPLITFYQDNRKEARVMKREKIEMMTVREITRMMGHPKYPHCFTLKFKGFKRVLLNADTEHDLETWLGVVCELTQKQYKREKVIWEYLDDGGLWQALPDGDSFLIEAHFNEHSTSFHLGDTDMAYHYNLNSLMRNHSRTRHSHRIKRTPFIEEQPEVLHSKMTDLLAIWEWGDAEKGMWHPFERETNIQIEDMYDSGSQWAELTLCLPSPMPFLLDLHDMKLVNFRTAVRYSLRRIDNSDNIQQGFSYPEARSPSPDDFQDISSFQENIISPLSPVFESLQSTLQHLQISRKNISYGQMLGEGAFGEVHLAEITGLPQYGEKAVEVAVKQLRLSDFIARHGHHSQQMEDFLREAKEMAKVDHHRVVKLLAVCTRDYPLLLIEEYMDQGDLLGVLKDSRPHMALTKQLTFAFHVADGMEYLSSDLNCVHRDLAARNILVREDAKGNMQAKVADFGLSRHLYSEMYKHQTSKPRPLPAKWMALESLMYFIFTTKSDVWSYGVLLWEIMTLGRTPYPGVENRELLEQIEEKGLKLSKPQPCPDVIYDVVLDCTQHDPDERPTFTQLRSKMVEYLKLATEGTLVCSDDGDSLPNSPAGKEASVSSSGTRHSDGASGSRPTEETDHGREGEASTVNPATVPQETTTNAPTTPVKEEEGREEPQATPYEAPSPSHSADTSEQKSPTERRRTTTATSPKLELANGGASLGSSQQLGVPQPSPPERAEESAEEKKTMSKQNSFKEVTQPLGHVYYLLDPLDDPLDPHDIDINIEGSASSVPESRGVGNHTHRLAHDSHRDRPNDIGIRSLSVGAKGRSKPINKPVSKKFLSKK